MLIILLSTYNCLLLPVEFAFSPPAFELNWNKALQLCIDVIFFADIPITFRTTYVDYGKEIFNPKKIAERYSKGSLMVDVVSCIPFDNIGMAMKVNDPTTLQLLRLLKLSRLFRLSRIITYLQTYKSLKTVRDFLILLTPLLRVDSATSEAVLLPVLVRALHGLPLVLDRALRRAVDASARLHLGLARNPAVWSLGVVAVLDLVLSLAALPDF